MIAVSGSGNALSFLGASTNGTQGGTGTVYFTDGTSEPFQLSFSDWWVPAPTTRSSRRRPTSTSRPAASTTPPACTSRRCRLQAGKSVAAVALPSDRHVAQPGTARLRDGGELMRGHVLAGLVLALSALAVPTAAAAPTAATGCGAWMDPRLAPDSAPTSSLRR